MKTAYKLLTYRSENGPRAGVLIGETVYDAAALTGRPAYVSTLDIVRDWEAAEPLLEAAAAKPDAGALGPATGLELLAPIASPAVYCAGANYKVHAQNVESVTGLSSGPVDGSVNPWFFLKTTHTIAGPGATIARPSESLDWEGELAFVIGRAARNVSEADALAYVAGYTVANDLSARDIMHRSNVVETSPLRYDWMSQKCFEGACPIGPWLVPASAVPDPQQLQLTTRVNGTVKQDSSTSEMIYSVATQIAFLSSRFTLHPGDLILTGTPDGTGIERGESLNAGDEVTVSVDGVGELVNMIA